MAEEARKGVGDMGALEAGLIDSRGADQRVTAELSAQPRADMPRQMMAQIVDVARFLPKGPVEVSLSPEELGG